ncbi:MAG: tRNA modification GTPase TrmE [Peptococcaceae bacterium]|jgi:tRNA modification GTPase|nr:tRNA modification GTPase TrmE [Peptococcaceae bacterium]
MNDTIAAVTTAMGAASVGIIRISGSEAGEIADKVFRSKKGRSLKDKKTYTITYGHVVDEEGKVVDEALALVMWGPHSFTGENVVELQCHGGMIILRKVLELVIRAGARLAEPGEFSKRAFLNGRLDLSQAEAIMDMINAMTEEGAQAAVSNLQGGLSNIIKEYRKQILEIMAYLEADIDFPEEDFTRLTPGELGLRISQIADGIHDLLQTFRSGRILREGLKTVLIGRPNVGKSSLLNALLKAKRAIVTDIPGTTRDVIEEYYNLGGIPLVLMDTAGIRETEDIVEKIGMEKTREAVEEADLILYVLDIVHGITEDDEAFIRRYPTDKIIVLANKIDLLKEELSEEKIKERVAPYRVHFVSAKEEIGLKELEEKIKSVFFENGFNLSDKILLNNVRHKEALERAKRALESAHRGVEDNLPSDFISIDLRSSWEHLGEITGETLEEDIIDQIFSQFCLGK